MAIESGWRPIYPQSGVRTRAHLIWENRRETEIANQVEDNETRKEIVLSVDGESVRMCVYCVVATQLI